MVDEDHLAILKQGVEAWNKWRGENPEIKPELNGANLSVANLSGIDLNRAYLARAIFEGTDLSGANLSRVSFGEAKLRNANLCQANLYQADFRYAEAPRANLSGANLQEAYLFKADLHEANLYKATLYRACLNEANLRDVDLRDADLREANLHRVDISGADLSNASLKQANLRRTIALVTNFTAAVLTGACIEDWQINSDTNLNSVVCDYIYRSYPQQKRYPLDRDFALGEFTKRLQQVRDIVELIFHEGIEWDAFACAYKRLQIENEDLHLDIKTIDNRNGVLVVTVQGIPEAYQVKWEKDFWQRYELALQTLEARYQGELKAKDGQIVLYERMISQSDRTITRHEKTIDQLIERIDTPLVGDINICGSQNISSAIGQTALSAASKYNLSLDKRFSRICYAYVL